jgi:hypothetical protein
MVSTIVALQLNYYFVKYHYICSLNCNYRLVSTPVKMQFIGLSDYSTRYYAVETEQQVVYSIKFNSMHL